MTSNLLHDKIIQIQEEYKTLLVTLLPELKSKHATVALDEITLFWKRHTRVVQLYLQSWFPGDNSYVFTAATLLDYDDYEHLPFLLVGDKHILDDPLGRYCEMVMHLDSEKDVDYFKQQIVVIAEDNIKILDNLQHNILIMPLRLFNQTTDSDVLFRTGEHAFISLFKDINGMKEYFSKCQTINDIEDHLILGVDKALRFSEDDDLSRSLTERFYIALSNTNQMISRNKNDAYNFFIIVYGFIQQSIDVLISCLEYGCTPYVRYPVANHYINILASNFDDLYQTEELCYKMNIAFAVYRLCDKERLSSIALSAFLRKIKDFDFSKKLFSALDDKHIDKRNPTGKTVIPVIEDNLEALYDALEESSV